MLEFEFEVKEEDAKERLDKFLVKKFLTIKPELTRSKIQKIIEEGKVIDVANSLPLAISQKTKLGQVIMVKLEKAKPHHLQATKIDFTIIYEDDDLLVINKPPYLTVHPGAGNQDNTLVNGLLFSHKNNLSSINGDFRPGIVHRLDKDTSGLMLVAKNDLTHQILSKNLQERKIKRSYLALIYGSLNPLNGVIKKNIVRSKNNRLKMMISRNQGRIAITNYKTKEIFLDGFASLIECELETGRTHQIRVHLESLHHSIIGDKLYNSSKKSFPKGFDEEVKTAITGFNRQALHSYKISFLHPISKKEMFFETELPEDILQLYKICVNNSSASK